MSPALIQRRRLEFQYRNDGIPTATPQAPKHLLPSVPSILCMQHRNPILGYSKAPWGLSVLSRVTGIFTGTTISPGGLLRQCPNHYAFHAGQNLPDKEFRYLRTVIVTAAVHWGFDSMLAHLLLTFQHRAGVSSYTSSFDLAQTCVFGKQLLGPILCGCIAAAPLLPKLRGQFAEFLNNPSPVGLRIFFLPTCVGLRYGHRRNSHSFSRHLPSRTSVLTSSIATGTNTRLRDFICVPVFNSFGGDGISTVCARRPHLSSRLTWSGRTFLQKPEAFGHADSHCIRATHSGILTSIHSTAACATVSPRIQRSLPSM